MPTREDRYIIHIESNEEIARPKNYWETIEEFVELHCELEDGFNRYEVISELQLCYDGYFKECFG